MGIYQRISLVVQRFSKMYCGAFKRSRFNSLSKMAQPIDNVDIKEVGSENSKTGIIETAKVPKMITCFAQAVKSAKIHYFDRFGTMVFETKESLS